MFQSTQRYVSVGSIVVDNSNSSTATLGSSLRNSDAVTPTPSKSVPYLASRITHSPSSLQFQSGSRSLTGWMMSTALVW